MLITIRVTMSSFPWEGQHAGFILACLIVAAFPAILSLLRIPDLPRPEAARLISRAPEFNRYARLLNVERVDHLKDSMDSVSYGLFTFVYLNSASDAPSIRGWADFRYSNGHCRLTQFDYGCDHSGLDKSMRATDCHIVDCFNDSQKYTQPPASRHVALAACPFASSVV